MYTLHYIICGWWNRGRMKVFKQDVLLIFGKIGAFLKSFKNLLQFLHKFLCAFFFLEITLSALLIMQFRNAISEKCETKRSQNETKPTQKIPLLYAAMPIIPFLPYFSLSRSFVVRRGQVPPHCSLDRPASLGTQISTGEELQSFILIARWAEILRPSLCVRRSASSFAIFALQGLSLRHPGAMKGLDAEGNPRIDDVAKYSAGGSGWCLPLHFWGSRWTLASCFLFFA